MESENRSSSDDSVDLSVEKQDELELKDTLEGNTKEPDVAPEIQEDLLRNDDAVPQKDTIKETYNGPTLVKLTAKPKIEQLETRKYTCFVIFVTNLI